MSEVQWTFDREPDLAAVGALGGFHGLLDAMQNCLGERSQGEPVRRHEVFERSHHQLPLAPPPPELPPPPLNPPPPPKPPPPLNPPPPQPPPPNPPLLHPRPPPPLA